MELIKIENNIALLEPETASAIADFERKMKDIKAKEDALKKAVMQEMEAKGIIKIDTDELTINYIAMTDRETFDTKRFRAENPLAYDAYVTMTPVKPSIRIKVK